MVVIRTFRVIPPPPTIWQVYFVDRDSYTISGRIAVHRLAPIKEVNDEDNQSDNEEQMDQIPSDMPDKPKQPEYDQNDKECY